PLRGLAQQQREPASQGAAAGSLPLELPFSQDGGVARAEDLNLQVGKRQLAHLLRSRVRLEVALQYVLVTPGDRGSDKGGRAGVGVGGHEATNIAAIPGLLLVLQKAADFVVRRSGGEEGCNEDDL